MTFGWEVYSLWGSLDMETGFNQVFLHFSVVQGRSPGKLSRAESELISIVLLLSCVEAVDCLTARESLVA